MVLYCSVPTSTLVLLRCLYTFWVCRFKSYLSMSVVAEWLWHPDMWPTSEHSCRFQVNGADEQEQEEQQDRAQPWLKAQVCFHCTSHLPHQPFQMENLNRKNIRNLCDHPKMRSKCSGSSTRLIRQMLPRWKNARIRMLLRDQTRLFFDGVVEGIAYSRS